MQSSIKLNNIKRLDNYLAQRASILKGIYLLNENILTKKLTNGERIILGVKVDNSYRIIEDTLNPFRFAYEFIGISWSLKVLSNPTLTNVGLLSHFVPKKPFNFKRENNNFLLY